MHYSNCGTHCTGRRFPEQASPPYFRKHRASLTVLVRCDQPPLFSAGTVRETVSKPADSRRLYQQSATEGGDHQKMANARTYSRLSSLDSNVSLCHRSCFENTGIMEARCGGGERGRFSAAAHENLQTSLSLCLSLPACERL